MDRPVSVFDQHGVELRLMKIRAELVDLVFEALDIERRRYMEGAISRDELRRSIRRWSDELR